MYISWKWLNELISLPVSIEEVADRLTCTGSEIEEIIRPCEKDHGIIIARVVSAERHPTKSGLTVTHLDIGHGEPMLCVTSAVNVKVGDKVPYCIPGSQIASGMELAYRDFDGFNSAGMMASAGELGLPDIGPSHGILILPPDAPVGEDVVKWLGLDDSVLDMSVTPNRGDLLSLFGTARELYALFPGSELHLPKIRKPGYQGDWTFPFDGVHLDTDGCLAYRLGLADNVHIAPSPLQIGVRLSMSGMRPISNVVDATNLVMLTLGQPMHAFDAASLPGKEIGVRFARDGEVLRSLDGKDRSLISSDMVIVSGDVPVALAGVMGGENSEITDKTQHVLIESANFAAPLVGKTSRRLGIPSEASFRYARGVDPMLTGDAMDYMMSLLVDWGAARVFAKGFYTQPKSIEKRRVPLTAKKLRRITSWCDMDESEKILKRYDIVKISGDSEKAIYEAPTRRADIGIEEDLIEEIARTRGYDDIKPTIPVIHKPGVIGPKMETHRLLRSVLIGRGYSEIVTYGFVTPDVLKKLRYPKIDQCKVITNPISTDTTMRPTLLPGLFNGVSKAVRVGWREPIRLFECSRAFVPQDGKIVEAERIAGIAFSGVEKRNVNGSAAMEDFLLVKSDVEALSQSRSLILTFRQGSHPCGHAGQTAEILAGGTVIGYLMRVKPAVAVEFDLDNPLYVFELDMAPFIAGDRLTYTKGYTFPPVYRDISMLVPTEVPCAKVASDLREIAGEMLHQVKLFDIYTGAGIPEGYRSLAFSMSYRLSDRTLTDEEVEKKQTALRSEMSKRGYKLR